MFEKRFSKKNDNGNFVTEDARHTSPLADRFGTGWILQAQDASPSERNHRLKSLVRLPRSVCLMAEVELSQVRINLVWHDPVRPATSTTGNPDAVLNITVLIRRILLYLILWTKVYLVFPHGPVIHGRVQHWLVPEVSARVVTRADVVAFKHSLITGTLVRTMSHGVVVLGIVVMRLRGSFLVTRFLSHTQLLRLVSTGVARETGEFFLHIDRSEMCCDSQGVKAAYGAI
ncbi:MAG: hypothetical protein ACYTGL_20075 [Planctomycetota bacterium]|jgi:hypothetical protein